MVVPLVLISYIYGSLVLVGGKLNVNLQTLLSFHLVLPAGWPWNSQFWRSVSRPIRTLDLVYTEEDAPPYWQWVNDGTLVYVIRLLRVIAEWMMRQCQGLATNKYPPTTTRSFRKHTIKAHWPRPTTGTNTIHPPVNIITVNRLPAACHGGTGESYWPGYHTTPHSMLMTLQTI